MTTNPSPAAARTGAEAVLLALKANGIDWLFANAGTDFPPVIEALAALPAESVPTPVTVPHETAAIAMAHGVYLVSGQPQSVMVHVNVGLANAVMGVINAASDNVPVVVMSGRTPLTETGREGRRLTPIQYGQEMFDQTAMVREAVKFDYEMRYPEQGGAMVARAVSLARTEPCGPVYLSLPREPLGTKIEQGAPADLTPRPAARPAAPDPAAVAEAAAILSKARKPLVICQRGDVGGAVARALSALGAAHGIGTVEPFLVRNVLAHDDPASLGYAPILSKEADAILVVDSPVPWIEATAAPAPGVPVIHIGPDPAFSRLPMRGFRNTLSITGAPAATLDAICATMHTAPDLRAARQADLAQRAEQRIAARARMVDAASASTPMGAEWLSHCLSEVMGDDAVIFSELGLVPAALRLKGPNRLFSNPHSGGLGWALPAALGAQLARPGKLTIAAMGDGSYIFANPVACHQIAEALRLPILIVVKNNAMWNAVRRSVVLAYPDGAAARANVMPLTALDPVPDFAAIARASRAHAEQVNTPDALPDALSRALGVIRNEGRSALLDVRVALSDSH
jgi:acetolactate synthase I/II/III large subunit